MSLFGRDKHRRLLAFYRRPMLPFVVEFALLAPLSFGVEVPGLQPLYLFAAPWLLLVLAALNLPFAGGAFQAFRLDLDTRRNHALEHATVLVLRARGFAVAGHAQADGFHISGGPAADDIRAAFEVVGRRVSDRAPLIHVSRHCGSNVVTALALALGLLLAVTAVNLWARPPLGARCGLLLGTVLAFVALHHGVGNWIQARWFTATDFSAVALRDVRKVRTRRFDRSPTYFVKTRIEP